MMNVRTPNDVSVPRHPWGGDVPITSFPGGVAVPARRSISPDLFCR